jgi:UDP-N-acetylglucosamine 2-epimerase (non-hydrolysing)
VAVRVGAGRMTIVHGSGVERGRAGAPAAAIAQHDGGCVVHVAGAADDAPVIAAAVSALGRTGAFDQLVIDATAAGAVAPALAELGASAPVRRVDPAARALPEALGAELRACACLAALLYGDDGVGVAGALAAARLGIAPVRVGRVAPAPPLDDTWPAGVGRPAAALPLRSAPRVIGRLADLWLVHGEDDVRALAALGVRERVHAIGNPLIDVVRRCAREAAARAAWRRLRVLPERYVLAVLAAVPAPPVAGALARLAAAVPLVADAPGGIAGARDAGAAGYVDRLSLERAAGAIVTDSPRVQEEAAALGVRCYALGRPSARVLAGAGGTTIALADADAVAAIRPAASAPTPCAIPLWDGRAGARLADVLVTNFARVRYAAD